jgi:carbon monoxide dehydrogenase subunit G
MPIHISRTIHIDAPPDAVWAVMTDVERWAEWTESMKSVERLEEGPFVLGSTAKLRIRRAPTAGVWRVTEITEGRSFTWENDSGGVHGVATHLLEPDGDGSKVTLTVTLSGLLVTLFGWLMAPPSRDNVRTEAEGLKRRCEDNPLA